MWVRHTEYLDISGLLRAFQGTSFEKGKKIELLGFSVNNKMLNVGFQDRLAPCPDAQTKSQAPPNLDSKPHDSGHLYKNKERAMSIGLILLIILILVLIGVLPTWPHSRSWGYYPSGGVGLVLVIIIVLLVMGRI
jgi:hypothetical protein